MLFGVEGLQVTDAQAGPDGTLEVWAVTDYPAAAASPDCQVVWAGHDTVLARPRDVRRAGDPAAVWWVKSRWKCDAPGCDRKTFTEWLPQVPPRCRLTARLREQAAHDAFAAAAGPVLEQAPRRWRTWGSMSTGAAGPGGASMSRPGSTCCSLTGGIPASLTCPGIRGCWARWRWILRLVRATVPLGGEPRFRCW